MKKSSGKRLQNTEDPELGPEDHDEMGRGHTQGCFHSILVRAKRTTPIAWVTDGLGQTWTNSDGKSEIKKVL